MEKNLVLFGTEYQVSEENVIYNEYREVFYTIADKSEQDFLKFYKEKAPEDRAAFDEAVEYGKKLINDGVNYLVGKLTEKNIYDYSADSIKRVAVIPITKFEESSNAVYNGLDAIENELRAAEAARQREIDSASSSWSGGGFGIEGALKGAAQAAVLNAASGLVTKAVTAGDSKRAKNAYEMKIYNLLTSTDTIKDLANSIYSDVFDLLKTYLKILVEDASEQVKDISDTAVVKSNDIFTNMTAGIYKDPEVEKSMWIRMLGFYPYDLRYFVELLKKHDEAFDEIIALMNWYHMPINKAADVLLCDKYNFSEINELQEAESQKQLLLTDLQKYGIESSGIVDEADKKIDEILVIRRTYDDVVYDTEEECANAKALDEKLAADITAVDKNSLEALMTMYLDITTGSNAQTFGVVCNKNALTMHNSILEAIKRSNSIEELNAYKEQLNTEANAELNAPIIKMIDSRIKVLGVSENLNAAKDKAAGAIKGIFGKAKGFMKK